MMGVPLHTEPPLSRPRPAPRLGEHIEEVLREVLEYDREQIDTLFHSGVLGSPRH